MKLLENNLYGYRSRHSVSWYMNVEKRHAAINNKLFNRLGYINDQLYEVELAKCVIEYTNPIIVGFFILQYGKLKMLELYCIFFGTFYGTDKYEEIERDTNSLFLALAEKEKCDCIRSEKRQEWELLRSKYCNHALTADACSNFFLRTCCAKHKKHDESKPGLFKNFLALKFCVCVAMHTAVKTF